MDTILPSGGDDSKLLQDYLNNGGTQIGTGIFNLTQQIIIPKNRSVFGKGSTLTKLRMKKTEPGEIIPGVVLLSDNSSIYGIATLSRDSSCNGIVAENINNYTIDTCQVCHCSTHSYGIWNHLSNNGKITNCIVNGNSPFIDNSIPQEGIELFGGDNIYITDCCVINLGRAGINLFQDENSSLSNVVILNCTVRNSTYGFYAACNGDSNSVISKVKIINNDFRYNTTDIKVAGGPNSGIELSFENNKYNILDINVANKYTKVKFI